MGVVLRYGAVYGPGTGIGEGGELVEAVRGGKMPLVGSAGGVWSFLHVDDMATATVAAIESRARGVYNVVDDDPAAVAEWLLTSPARWERGRLGAFPHGSQGSSSASRGWR